jgi:hypothetical protein
MYRLFTLVSALIEYPSELVSKVSKARLPSRMDALPSSESCRAGKRRDVPKVLFVEIIGCEPRGPVPILLDTEIDQPLTKANTSGLIVSGWVVHMPCGRPG